jgi:CRISPR/Cas system-associated exonuclease Cas4 (RecB family)
MEKLFAELDPSALEKARDGTPVTVKFKGFPVRVLPASQLNVPEQLSFDTDSILVGEPELPLVETTPRLRSLELTASDVASMAGCLRYFHWTRIAGQTEPGTQASAGDAMRLGSNAHRFLETGLVPSREDLRAAGVEDLGSVFESQEWRHLSAASPERELPFVLHLQAAGKECWIRGRMDAVVGENVPRVIDYKYAVWREGDEAAYEVQMMTYSLALMKALDAANATAELWYLKDPLKIVRREYARDIAETRLQHVLSEYVMAIEQNRWPAADRAHCERVQCGFRSVCW